MTQRQLFYLRHKIIYLLKFWQSISICPTKEQYRVIVKGYISDSTCMIFINKSEGKAVTNLEEVSVSGYGASLPQSATVQRHQQWGLLSNGFQ